MKMLLEKKMAPLQSSDGGFFEWSHLTVLSTESKVLTMLQSVINSVNVKVLFSTLI